MSNRGREALGAAIALRIALERTADALSHSRLDKLLESETGLAAALAVLPVGLTDLGAERERVLLELGRAREELARCRRLGGALSGVVAMALGGRGVATESYGADGRWSGNALTSTAGALEARG